MPALARAQSASLPDWAGRAPDGAQPRIVVPAPENPRFHHLGWPKAVRTAEGTIVLGFLSGKKHPGENCPMVAISTDGGKTFSEPQMLREFVEGRDYDASGNMALGLAHDGAVLLLAHGYSKNSNHIFGWRSTDSGRTWKPVDTSALGPNKTGSSTGHIAQLPGKRLKVVGHYRDGSEPYERGVWRSISEDDGLTWGQPALVSDYPAAQLWRGDPGTLCFKHDRTLLEMTKLDRETNDDYGYAWLVPMEGRRVLMFYYHGKKTGPNPIWVLDTEL